MQDSTVTVSAINIWAKCPMQESSQAAGKPAGLPAGFTSHAGSAYMHSSPALLVGATDTTQFEMKQSKVEDTVAC